MKQQNRTFAHVVRADQQDPMKQMTVNAHLEILGSHLRRVGLLRNPWVHAKCKWLYEKVHLEYDHELDEHKAWVRDKCEAGL